MTTVNRRSAILALLMTGFGLSAGTASAGDYGPPDLGQYTNLKVPAGNKYFFHRYAEGVQIYSWNGTSWVFVAPEAFLYLDDDFDFPVGIHYVGPTWEGIGGSKVVGTVVERATPDPTAIPWLLLKAVSNEGFGLYRWVTYIQRVHTEGGLAPAGPGSYMGEVVRVPYTADYYFYRAQH